MLDSEVVVMQREDSNRVELLGQMGVHCVFVARMHTAVFRFGKSCSLSSVHSVSLSSSSALGFLE